MLKRKTRPTRSRFFRLYSNADARLICVQVLDPRWDPPHALHEPAPFHFGPPNVEHVRTQPEGSAGGIQQQVHHLEHAAGGTLASCQRVNSPRHSSAR